VTGRGQDEPEDRLPFPTASAAHSDLRDEYLNETGRLIRRRLTLTVVLFLLFIGVGVYAETVSHPERRAAVLFIYGLEIVACVTTLAAVHIGRLRHRIAAITAALGSTLAFCLSAYSAIVRQNPETLAIAQVCLMTGVAVLLPWGARAQLAVCLASIASFGASLVWAEAAGATPYPWLAVVTGATTSVWGAFFLDGLRYEAFARTAELAQASAVKQEEAEVATALTHVGETLSAAIGRRDVFEAVNRLAVQLLECDWSSTFVFDEQRSVFRFGSNVGSPPEVVTELAEVEFARGSLPMHAEFRPGHLVEVPDASSSPHVPAELGVRWHVASAVYVPIWRGEQLIGVLAAGYGTRRGTFSRRQRRLALGIANAAAIALENERLVVDLQAADRLKSEFVSTMSHELRTPLNVITGYAEMLGDPETGSLTQEQRDLLNRIQRNAESLLDLISSTLDLGRLEAGRDPLHFDWVDLHLVFAQIAEEVTPLARENRVEIRWRREGAALFEIRTDRGKLKTILKNLVANAVKFTPGGTVEVLASGDEEVLTLSVSDDGIGIAAEDHDSIFEMFRQVDSSAASPFGGVGLGLHIARRQCERLGGTIAVASQRGSGATFTVTLPVQFAAPESLNPG
jgi:signal transduction histidine kinase